MEGRGAATPEAQRFPALSIPHFRLYAITAGLSMVADNIEHVIGFPLPFSRSIRGLLRIELIAAG